MKDLFSILAEYKTLGGKGSGYHGHAGRPGKKGGSGSGKKEKVVRFGWKARAQEIESFGVALNKQAEAWLDSDDDNVSLAIKGLQSYVNENNHTLINGRLRSKGKLTEGSTTLSKEVFRDISGIDSLMKNSTVHKTVIVSRGIDDDVFKKLKRRIGKTFVDKGFVSTTLKESILYPEQNMPYSNVIRVKVPKGTHAFYVNRSKWFGQRNEYELLLDRGLKYKVTGDKYDISLEVIK